MLESQSVKELQNIIKSRQISIKEVVEYYLDRIEKLNPDLNAIVLQKDRELIIGGKSSLPAPNNWILGGKGSLGNPLELESPKVCSLAAACSQL